MDKETQAATNEVIQSVDSALDYKAPTTTGARVEGQFEEQFGKLPMSRWKNVGRIVMIKLTNDLTSASVGDTFYSFHVPQELDGSRLVEAHAAVTTVSAASGPILINVAIGANDLLSTRINIDDNEKTSYTAATQSVPNELYNIVRTGDQIDVDIDDIGDGAAKGWQLILSFQ